ncbi:MAG: hypothetical protein RJB66_2606 [Pseudomonadota bacterium]|jgi:hypothetical protein
MASSTWTYIKVHPETKIKVDRKDLSKIEKHKWRITYGASGRPRVVTSVRTENGVKNITLGAFLMKPPAGKQVYARRFNEGLDYRRDNLVVCTLKERQRLLPKARKDASSIFRGVSFAKGSSNWRAGIEVDGVSINLGNFASEKDAASAYNRAARKYFGKLAYQNDLSAKTEKRKIKVKK